MVEFYQTSYIDILQKVRDKIHKGHKLLTHPLSSSLKPNETPYKTILISQKTGSLDMDSVMAIENSINTTLKFIKDKKTPQWNESILKDFQVIDLSLVESILENNKC